MSVTNVRTAFPVYVSEILAHNKIVTRTCHTWIPNLLSLFRIEGSSRACSRINRVASTYCGRKPNKANMHKQSTTNHTVRIFLQNDVLRFIHVIIETYKYTPRDIRVSQHPHCIYTVIYLKEGNSCHSQAQSGETNLDRRAQML